MENGIEKTQLANSGFNTTQMISGNATMMTPGCEATQMGEMITCPVCHAKTPCTERYCSDCGFLLSSVPVEVADAPSPESYAKLIDPTDGKEFLLNPGANTVGRMDADVLLSHPTVSRKHAQITISESICVVEDFGSSNGTYVGNTKVEPGNPVQVADGMELRFGSATLKYEAPKAVEAAETAPAAQVEPAGEVTQMPAQDDEAPEVALDAIEATEAPATVEETPVEPEPMVPTLAKLVAKVGGEEFEIKEGENTIGRRPTNSIAIPDPYISGSHGKIAASEGSFVFTDIGSTNGSSLNGEKVNPNDPKNLSDGDELTVGQTSFTFTVVQPEEPAATEGE